MINSIIKQINGRAQIVAATKTQPVQAINALKGFGINIAGENRVQEFLEKYDKVEGMEWHFIGRLQTNKVKYIIDKVSLIHSLDRARLADEIELECQKRSKTMDVLIELNMGEETKGGVSLDELSDLARYVVAKKHLRLKGLMCLPPLESPDEVYEKINGAYMGLKRDFGVECLSLGTSNDYLKAIEYGSNMVRLGTALFGKREK